jgi:tRNA 2-selenouridine synthase
MIDVRSPGEFQHGHITGAHNIPLFSDDERAEIGTLYKQQGRTPAVMRGLDIVGPKMSGFVSAASRTAVDNTVLVHCWRGGMRSGSCAWLLDLSGLTVHLLEGGYKEYRRYARAAFARDANIVILSGMTGSGKTDILLSMKRMGEQVLDLEGIACHKGSSFGSIGQGTQPSNEQFENDVFREWNSFDFSAPVWIEDESRKIGRVVICDTLWEQMRRAPVVKIEVGRNIRIQRLVDDYTSCDPGLLIDAVNRIENRLGGQNAAAVINLIGQNEYYKAIDMILDYYDRTYTHGMQKRESKMIQSLTLPGDFPEDHARRVIDWYRHGCRLSHDI